MSLIDRLIARSMPVSSLERRRVLVRVWLDEEGRVRDLKVRRSSGDPSYDDRALQAIAVMKFPRGQLGSGSAKAQRWHDLTYALE
ncbi:energy transducer TonB family protein [Burkholderia sp. BCC0322]|uniref:energy transducer TonB family protein n=1 Tax=unclassified Burkholderia TaxID=2613784 RepID=UPI00158CF340|nr:energy transducer TonB [Burkholderia sp. BCC0322]